MTGVPGASVGTMRVTRSCPLEGTELDGTTETYPLAVERFGDRKALKQLFEQDGGHLLMVLSALQSP